MDLLNKSSLTSTPQLVNDALGYFNLVAIALLCVLDGSRRSVSFLVEKQKSGKNTDVLSTKDVAIFPLMASGTLVSAYVLFRILSKEYTNMLISFYFLLIGTAALFRAVRPLFHRLLPDFGRINSDNRYLLALYKVGPDRHKEDENDAVERWYFDTKDLLTLSVCSTFSIWYFLKKHWIANNIIAAALSIEAIEMLQLDKFTNAVMLLCGLFVYDVFWVFGTNVMVSVAKNLQGPIKIVWPSDIFQLAVWAGTNKDMKYAMLGLGDIVVPGIFVAFLRRFDYKQKMSKPTGRSYHRLCFVCYFLALVCTVVVMKVFKRAQPALLYIVPFCLLPCVVQALIQGDLSSLLAYRDASEESERDKSK